MVFNKCTGQILNALPSGERANGKINPRHWRHVCGQLSKQTLCDAMRS